MTLTLQEIPDSREQEYTQSAAQDRLTLLYKAVGEQDDAIVRQYVADTVPLKVNSLTGVLYIAGIRLRPDGFQQYFVDVEYARVPPRNSYTFSFDTTGGTAHVDTARAHVGTYNTSGVVANDAHAGTIGVKDDGSVDGVDIIVPKLRFNLAFKYTSGRVTIPFVKGLASITGTTNEFQFLGFEAGELLFMGASGEDGSDSEMQTSFSFEASANEENFQVGHGAYVVTVGSKRGHDYAWVSHQDVVVDGVGRTVPDEVHVEQVYLPSDFASYFQWNIYTG